MQGAETNELTPKALQIFESWDHVNAWVQLWGAQNMPMMRLPGGNVSKRIYVCRHPVASKFRREAGKKLPVTVKPPVKPKHRKGSAASASTSDTGKVGVRQLNVTCAELLLSPTMFVLRCLHFLSFVLSCFFPT